MYPNGKSRGGELYLWLNAGWADTSLSLRFGSDGMELGCRYQPVRVVPFDQILALLVAGAVIGTAPLQGVQDRLEELGYTEEAAVVANYIQQEEQQ